jgi:hypothetical protein
LQNNSITSASNSNHGVSCPPSVHGTSRELLPPACLPTVPKPPHISRGYSHWRNISCPVVTRVSIQSSRPWLTALRSSYRSLATTEEGPSARLRYAISKCDLSSCETSLLFLSLPPPIWPPVPPPISHSGSSSLDNFRIPGYLVQIVSRAITWVIYLREWGPIGIYLVQFTDHSNNLPIIPIRGITGLFPLSA